MTPGVPFALGAMLFFGVADVIYKRAGRAGVLPHHLLMVQSWVFLSSVTCYGVVTGSLVFVAGSLWGAGAGLFMWLAFYNFAHSLTSGAVSVNAPIFRLSFVLTAVLAIVVLGETLSAAKLGGILLAVVAVWLLLFERMPGGRTNWSSLMRVGVATLAAGVGNLLLKRGLLAGATPASLVVLQACVVVTASTALAWRVDLGIRPSGAALRHAPVAAVLLAAAFALLVEGLARGDASVMVPISQMGLAVSALVGFAALGEVLSARKGAGLVAAVAALVCFCFG